MVKITDTGERIGKLTSIRVPYSVHRGQYLFVWCRYSSGDGHYKGCVAHNPEEVACQQYGLVAYSEQDIINVYDCDED